MSIPQQLVTIGVIVLGTMLTRFLPFFIFPDNRPTPPFVRYLGCVLPAAVFGGLLSERHPSVHRQSRSARADRCLCRYCAASVETADASFYCRRNFRLYVPGSAGISRSVTVQNHDFPCCGNHIPSQGRSFSKTQKSLPFLAIDLFLKEKCSLFRS